MRCSTGVASTESGFTLVEVMLSVAIVAMMTTLLWVSFSVSNRGRQAAEDVSRRYHQVRLALNRIAREISMSFLSRNRPPAEANPRTLFRSKKSSDVDELMFSTMAHMRLRENAKESDQTLISYSAVPAPGNEEALNLVRRESRRLGGERPEKEGSAYVVVEDVKELHFEFYDEQQDKWRDEWDTTSIDGQADRLPRKVRVFLTVLDERGEETTFRTAARTHLRDPLWLAN